MSTKDEIRDSLRTQLNKNGMKNVELAKLLGVSKGAVTNWLNGTNSIDIELVPRICDIFGISVDEFLGHGHIAEYSLSQEERRLVSIYRGLSYRDKAILMQMADSLSCNTDMFDEECGAA